MQSRTDLVVDQTAHTPILTIPDVTEGSVETAPLNCSPSALRVRPETLCRITEFSEHESNGRELDEGERVAVEVLPVLGQSAAAVEPGDGAFDQEGAPDNRFIRLIKSPDGHLWDKLR